MGRWRVLYPPQWLPDNSRQRAPQPDPAFGMQIFPRVSLAQPARKTLFNVVLILSKRDTQNERSGTRPSAEPNSCTAPITAIGTPSSYTPAPAGIPTSTRRFAITRACICRNFCAILFPPRTSVRSFIPSRLPSCTTAQAQEFNPVHGQRKITINFLILHAGGRHRV